MSLGPWTAVEQDALSDGSARSYEFPVNDKMEPMLKVKDGRLIAWNPTTRRIKQDGRMGRMK